MRRREAVEREVVDEEAVVKVIVNVDVVHDHCCQGARGGEEGGRGGGRRPEGTSQQFKTSGRS